MNIYSTVDNPTKKSVGQKSLWIFVPGLKTDKRREQKQPLRK
ncbi:hypothetical protein D923_02626 [Enterococcus faecalis 06-MB-S-04]|nr:hypothetical protein D923_02626 [Enterococcus faecalis 06-MB-S-04]